MVAQALGESECGLAAPICTVVRQRELCGAGCGAVPGAGIGWEMVRGEIVKIPRSIRGRRAKPVEAQHSRHDKAEWARRLAETACSIRALELAV